MKNTSLPRTMEKSKKSFDYRFNFILWKTIMVVKSAIKKMASYFILPLNFYGCACDKKVALIIKFSFFKEVFMYPKSLLWNLRTNLPMHFVLEKLEDSIHIPYKESEGFIRFLCQNCNEMRATINPKNNLSHCFSCNKNLNNIDLMMANGHTFSGSIETLTFFWDEYKKRSQAEVPPSTWQ
jgi:hypothetical protein